jgi:hypothetical protein
MKQFLFVLVFFSFQNKAHCFLANVVFLSTKPKIIENIKINKSPKPSQNKEKVFVDNCKLMEEQIDGKTEIKYIYDAKERLVEKRYERLKYSETFSYDENGFLSRIADNSTNPFTIDYKYENGLLISRTKQFRRLSDASISTYTYNSSKELIKMTESYMGNITTTDFVNKKAVKITNKYIYYELNARGLVVAAYPLTGPKTVNNYKYDQNDMLVLHEIYADLQNKILQNDYKNSKIKRNNLGAAFVDNYKGFPNYKNPFGEQTFFVERITNYTTKNNTLQKVHEEVVDYGVDATGKIMRQGPMVNSKTPTSVFIYAGCQ